MSLAAEIVKGLVILDVAQIATCWLDDLFTANSDAAVGDDGVRVADHEQTLERVSLLLSRLKADQEACIAFWPLLAQNNITMHKLLAFLYRDLRSTYSRKMLVATLYLQLLQLPGSEAFGLFNNIMLDGTLRRVRDVISSFLQTDVDEKENNETSEDQVAAVDTSMAKKKKKATSRKGKQRASIGDEEIDEEQNIDKMDLDVVENQPHDAKRLVTEFLGYISKAELQKHEDLVTLVVEILMTFLEGVRSFSSSSLPPLIRQLIQPINEAVTALCTPRFGPLHDTVTKIFRGVLQLVLLLRRNKAIAGSTIPKPFIDAHHNAIALLLSVIEICNNEKIPTGKTQSKSQEKVFVLLQHLCTKVVDRAEYRALVAQGVFKLLQHATEAVRHQFSEWLSKLCRNTKVSYRVFAVDLLAVLLHQNVQAEMEQMWTLLTSRVHDKMPSVRARAISVLIELVPQTNKIDLLWKNALVADSDSDGSGWLKRRCRDEKSVVRKAAIQLIRALLEHTQVQQDFDFAPLISWLEERCGDPIMTLRKLAASELTEVLLMFPQNDIIWKAWSRAIFPMVVDREASVQDEAVTQSARLLLQPWRDEKLIGLREKGLMMLAVADGSHVKHFQRMAAIWAKKGEIKKDVATAIANYVQIHSNHLGGWILLTEIYINGAAFANVTVPLQTWKDMRDQGAPDEVMAVVIRALGVASHKLAKEDAASLIDEFRTRLCTFRVPIPLITAMIECASQIFKHANGVVTQWSNAILSECDRLLSNNTNGTTIDDETLSRCLFIVGEIYQINPGMVSERTLTAIQTLIASPTDQMASSRNQNHMAYPPAIRAQGFVTLGKICLLNEDFAKKYVAAFARELALCKEAVVRNNVMLVLCDLCVRYAALVDKHIPTIAICLHDDNELVRRQTLTMLTKLLQEDYIKWKSSLFCRFVTSLADESQDIKEFGEYCLVQFVLNKNPTIFYSNFQELIYFLNNYAGPRAVEKLRPHDGDDRSAPFTGLTGTGQNAIKRRNIYAFLASHLTDELRFQLVAKLCTDILAGVIEGSINVDQSSGFNVIADTLQLLGSKEMKLQSRNTAATDDDVTESEKAIEDAKSKLLTKLTKKNTVENILPIVISLKRHLETLHSPLLRDVMLLLRSIVKDFRVEMEDIMASDRQLANEIEFDIRQFEKQEAQQKIAPTPKRITQTPLKAKPVAQSPRRHDPPTLASSSASAHGGITPGTPPPKHFLSPRLLSRHHAPSPRDHTNVFGANMSPVLPHPGDASSLMTTVTMATATLDMSSLLTENQTAAADLTHIQLSSPHPHHHHFHHHGRAAMSNRLSRDRRSWNVTSPLVMPSSSSIPAAVDRKRGRGSNGVAVIFQMKTGESEQLEEGGEEEEEEEQEEKENEVDAMDIDQLTKQQLKGHVRTLKLSSDDEDEEDMIINELERPEKRSRSTRRAVRS